METLQSKVIYFCVYMIYCVVADSRLRLTGGGLHYGFVEIQIENQWKPVCPGENNGIEKLSNAICVEMGYVSGHPSKMSQNSNAPDWFYNDFYREASVPNIDAFALKKWRIVSGSGEFAYCKTSTVSVLCQGKVKLEIANEYALNDVTERGFGRVVITPPTGSPGYIDPASVDATGVKIMCTQLGFNVSTKINPDQTIGYIGPISTYVPTKYNCVGTEASILDCPAVPLTDGITNKPTTISCSNTDTISDYTVRLSSFYNLVEIRYQNTWGLICGDAFTSTDATVVCKSLGFTGSTHSTTRSFNRLYPVFIKSLNCAAQNMKPSECSKVMWDTRCDSAATVRCFDAQAEGSYLLSDASGNVLGPHFIERTSNNQKGILAIQISKQLSDGSPHPKICKGLGYLTGFGYDLPLSALMPQNTKYWFGTYINSGGPVTCSSIDACFDNNWQLLNYDSPLLKDKVQMTVCYNKVYLEGNGFSGTVIYADNGPPFVIDDETLNQAEVNLICKELGFTNGGYKLPTGLYVPDTNNGMKNMDCSDTPASITSDCTFSTINDITGIAAATIACNLTAILPAVNQAATLGSEGVLLVNKNGIPARVCSDTWSDKESTVVCRELGFDSASYYTKSQRYENGKAGVGYKSVTCNGNEDALKECTLVDKTAADECDKVVALTCYDKSTNVFKLVDGGDRFGRIKLTRENKEGYYCPFKFDEEDAATVCREVGFDGGDEIKMAPVTAAGTTWWSIDTNCDDDTQVIEACEGGTWQYVEPANPQTTDCTWKTAAVYCYSKVHLKEHPYLSYGIVEQTNTKIRYDSNSFGTTEATVACKEMGYSQGGVVISNKSFKKKKTPITVKCSGNEASLLDCPTATGNPEKTDFATVACTTGETLPAEGTLKINDDLRVLVVRNGVWAALCASKWTAEDANVACRQLTGAGGKLITRRDKLEIPYPNMKEAWTCVGTEQKLADCSADASAVDEYCEESAGVLCDNHQASVEQTVTYLLPAGVSLPPGDTPDSTSQATTGDNAASTKDSSTPSIDDSNTAIVVSSTNTIVADSSTPNANANATAKTAPAGNTASFEGSTIWLLVVLPIITYIKHQW